MDDSDRGGIDRRQFATGTTAGLALLAAHALLPGAGAARGAEKRPSRIRTLGLRTAAPLPHLRDFYHGKIGLPVVEEGPARIGFVAGESRFTFTTAAPDEGEPFYHFAFNIPENKAVAALEWQRTRAQILPAPETLRDPDFPSEIVWFRHWNAHSVFFFDPAGNVVEYIARHDLRNAAPGPFGPADLLCASEIALIVDNVPASAESLRSTFSLPTYRGASEVFEAVGDESGLLLVMRRGRALNLRPGDPAKRARVFGTTASLRGPAAARWSVSGFPYEVIVTG